MTKLLNGNQIISIENPKDFFGEVQLNSFIIITHDMTFLLDPSNKKYKSTWLNQKELDRAIKKARKWTLFDSAMLSIKRTFLKLILTEKEQDDFQYGIN